MATATTRRTDAEAFIDTIDPAAMRDGTNLRAVAAARERADEAEAELVDTIRAARAAGDSWAAIGLVLRTSKQNAHRKYAALVGDA
ncbi:MAG: hypothetical protein FWD18_03270 [Micrococcales bacterium]|nr:hypothetical protein [Micrococcales bacterium]